MPEPSDFLQRREYQTRFDALLASLTEEQRRAVSAIEGPVLVIAGPGTGKTHILAARIGEILRRTDTQAHQILCLTFTESAVLSMRNRLRHFMGDDAYRVPIYTFHSFCNRVIQENLETFGRRLSEPLSDLERIEFVRSLLYELPKDNPLARQSDPYFYEDKVRTLFQTMKAEGWTSDLVEQAAQAYLDDLPNRPEYAYKRKTGTFEKGDLKMGQIKKEQQNMELLCAAARLFDAYRTLLERHQRHDFEDMLRWVSDAFEQDEFLLRRYQEQFLYVLVDEFQDTNGVQYGILQQLVAYWEERPNLFLVGDDDQSIYEFQGARLKNVLDFYKEYERVMEWVVLPDNFRSTTPILRAAYELIGRNRLRLIEYMQANPKPDKRLRAANSELTTSKTEPLLLAYERLLDEDLGALHTLQEWHEKGIAYGDMAVIYCKHKQSERLTLLLDKASIPYSTRKQIDALKLPWMQQLLQVMRYVQRETAQPYKGEDLLYDLLYCEFWGLPDEDVLALAEHFAKQKNEERVFRWRDFLSDAHRLNALKLRLSERVLALGGLLKRATLNNRNLSLPEWLEWFSSASGLLSYLCRHAQKAVFVPALHALFDFVQNETRKNPKLNLRTLLELLSSMEKNGLGLPVHPSSRSDGEGVRLMTAHASKGLEFKAVLVLHAVADIWEKNRDGRHHFALPDTLIPSNQSDAEEASRRLFYVALTRAREHLVISYHLRNDADRTAEPTRYVDELRPVLSFKEIRLNPAQVQLGQELSMRPIVRPERFLLEEGQLRELLADFKLSASALDAYLRCPFAFYFQHVLRLPSLPGEAAVYGTAVHAALKRLFDRMQSHPERHFPPAGELTAWFVQELRRETSARNLDTFERLRRQGELLLPLYYQNRLAAWIEQSRQTTIYTERAFKNLEFEGIPLSGHVDKIVVFNQSDRRSVLVVDYKSGKIDDKRLEAPQNGSFGGSYWRQLHFYALLLDCSKQLPYPVRQAQIDYLNADPDGAFPIKSIDIDAQGRLAFQDLLRRTYRDIQDLKFAQGCGESGCQWCNLAQRQARFPENMRDEETELMDDV